MTLKIYSISSKRRNNIFFPQKCTTSLYSVHYINKIKEWARKAGRPQRREARGSERPGGPVVGGLRVRRKAVPTSRPGLAHGSNPTPGPSFHSPMMVRAAETMTTGSESALILPHNRLPSSSYGPQNSRLSEPRGPAPPRIHRATGRGLWQPRPPPRRPPVTA